MPLNKKVVRTNHAPYITKTLRKVYFNNGTPDSLINLKNKRITVADNTKKSGENISKVLIQEGSVTTKVFGKIYSLFSLKN